MFVGVRDSACDNFSTASRATTADGRVGRAVECRVLAVARVSALRDGIVIHGIWNKNRRSDAYVQLYILLFVLCFHVESTKQLEEFFHDFRSSYPATQYNTARLDSDT